MKLFYFVILVSFCMLALTAPAFAQTTEAPGPSAALFAAPFYSCVNNFYVSTTGSDSNPGTLASPWLTLQHADSAAPHAGDCINVEPGTYAGGVVLTHGGNLASPTGYVVYRCTQLDACKITNASNGFRISSSSTGGPNYLVFDGFELAASSKVTYGVGIALTETGNSPSAHHLWMLNNIIHDFGQSGIDMDGGDYLYYIHNTAYGNSNVTCDAQGSGFTVVVPKAVANYTPTASDLALEPFHIRMEWNISHDNMLTQCGTATNPYDTDGNGLITDDFANQGSSNVLYPNQTLVLGNVSYRNGGAGIIVGRSSHVTVTNNTAFDNYLDPFNNATARGEILVGGGTNDTIVNNIAYALPATSASDPRCQGVNYSVAPWNLPNACPLQGNYAFGGGSSFGITDTGNLWSNNVSFGGTPPYVNQNGNAIFTPDTINCSTTGSNPNQCNVNPLITNAAGGIFTLETGSPAIGYALVESFNPGLTNAGAYQSAMTAPAVNGLVGSDKNKDFLTLSSTDPNLCAAGSVSDFTATSTGWTWSCAGLNGGATDTSGVAGLIVNGLVGADKNKTFLTLSSTDPNLCAAGTVSAFTTTFIGWMWSCSGINGGTTDASGVATQISNTAAAETPGPSATLYNTPFYTCLANFYVATNGSDSNPGTKTSPWLTIQHADSSSRKAGDCINVAPGIYQANILIQHGGNAPTPTGYVAYRCETLDGCHVLAPGAGHLWGIMQPANFIVIDGFEVDGNNALQTDGIADACIVSSGDDFGTGNASHHIWVLNNIVHHCNLAGIGFGNKEWYYVLHNTSYHNAFTSGYQGSGIGFVVVQCIESGNPLCASGPNYNGGTGTYTPSGMDLTYVPPFHNVVSANNVFDNMIAANNPVPCGAHTDGNGIIMDTFLDETTLTLIYPFQTLVTGNVSYANGGRGIHVFRTSNVTVANNTVYGNGTDTCINGFGLADLSNIGGSNNVWINNVAQSVVTPKNLGPGCNTPGSEYCGDNNVPLQAGACCNLPDTNNTYLNNITFGGVGPGILTSGDTGVSLFNNDLTYFSCSNNKCNTNPELVKPASDNFALEAGSPAIGYGQTQSFLPASAVDAGACSSALSTCPETVPVASAVSATVAYDSSNNAIALNLSGGTPVSVAIASAAAHGTATASGTTIAYTPATGFFGTDSFAYTATNSTGTSSAATVSITISAPSISVTPATLAAGTAGTPYSQSLTASGGQAPYSFSTKVASGALPGGLSLSSSGAITGTPTAAGIFTFTVSGADSSTNTPANFTSATLTLTIASAPKPAVSSVNPVSGTTAGGTSVTINGANLTGATAVKFGGAAATAFTVVSATQIAAITPAGSPGTVDVTVTTPQGTSVTTAADQYAYVAPGPVAPLITTNPSNQTVNAGLTATFVAAATGSPAPSVKWQVSTDSGSTFTNIPGATFSTLSFIVQFTDNGTLYRAVFTNTGGSATTSAAKLNVPGPAATPTFNPPEGTYTAQQMVSIVETTPGATVYYTTNGTTPTTSSKVYSGPIAVASTERIAALAVATGFAPSTVGVAAYVINLRANLVATGSLTRSGNSVIVQLTISNTGGEPAEDVVLTFVKVGADIATPLPQSIGTIATGASAQVTVTVPGSVGPSGTINALDISGTYSGGIFNEGMRIKLP